MRKRALDLLYGMCDKTNSKEIVSEMVSYLETADVAIREELVRQRERDTGHVERGYREKTQRERDIQREDTEKGRERQDI